MPAPMPFAWPLDYQSGYPPPAEAPAQALWFVFRRGQLLVTAAADGAAELKPAAHPQQQGLKPLREHYLGQYGEWHCYTAEAPPQAEIAGLHWQPLRDLHGRLDEDLFAIAGRAAQLLEWERTHRHCGVCGSPTRAHALERARECTACGHVVWPRISPAIMALVRDGKRLLLGRSAHFRAGVFSALAGFVEPGETLEQCVAREVREEVGVEITHLRYVASQPWPFPHQLMIGFFCDYAGGELRVDTRELEAADWFDIAHLPPLPGKISLARQLIDAAVGEMQASLSINGRMGIYAN